MNTSPKPSGQPDQRGPRTVPGVAHHAREQCLARYGVDLTDEEWLAAWLDIVEGRSVLLRMESKPYGEREIHALQCARLQRRTLFVGYAPDSGTITTALPDEARVTRVRHRPAKPKRGRRPADRGLAYVWHERDDD